jgi:hypothetical protein
MDHTQGHAVFTAVPAPSEYKEGVDPALVDRHCHGTLAFEMVNGRAVQVLTIDGVELPR